MEEGLTTLRTAQHQVCAKTWDNMARTDLKLEVTDFYLLPGFAREIERLKSGTWGPNRLSNGSFESDEGWGGAKLGHDTTGKVAIIEAAGRDGSRALRLASSSPTIYQGKPRDWVTANVVSEKIPAKSAEIWQIAAWVRLPKDFEQTKRGLTIALFAYDAEGKRIRGYGAQDLEAAQVKETSGWKQIRLLVPLRSKDVTAIAASLSVCGVGEALLDDVTVQRL